MDADDLSHPKRLEEQLFTLQEKNADVCGCDFYTINKEGKITEFFSTPLTNKDCFERLVLGVPYCHGSLFFKSSTIKKFLYDINSFTSIEDYYLQVRIAQSGLKFTKVKKRLYYLRIHNNSYSNTKTKLMRSEAINLSNKFLNENVNNFNISENKSIMKLLISELTLIKEKKIIICYLKKRNLISSCKYYILLFIYYTKYSLYLIKRVFNKIFCMLFIN